MFGDPHYWERALMWATGQEEERNRKAAKEREEERRREMERQAFERYVRDNNILSEPIQIHDEIERYEREKPDQPETYAERLARYGDPDRSNIEDRRGEHPMVPAKTDAGAPPPPQGWPHGWEHTIDPRWFDPNVPGKLRSDLPPDVRQGLEEDEEFTRLRGEREGDPEEGYEATRSPLVLMKRHPNGTVTYVHALTGQPLFEEGLYGMNDPQGAERENPWDEVYDPYWRAGRRDW